MNEECKERENYWVLLKSVVGKMLESVIKYVMTQDVKNNSLTSVSHDIEPIENASSPNIPIASIIPVIFSVP